MNGKDGAGWGGILLCCIGKNENDYIREFVEHHKALGFTHIRLYDNNDPDGEDFLDAVGDYVGNGFVTVVNFRGCEKAQMKAYDDCFRNASPGYGWTAFFDCDEFLDLGGRFRTVREWLEWIPNLERYDIIHINWRIYDDNGLTENDGRPLMQRLCFPRRPLDWSVTPGGQPENHHIKSIVRSVPPPVNWGTPHTPVDGRFDGRVCDWAGRPVANAPLHPCDFGEEDAVVLRHYCTKTISEYLEHKFRRGFPDRSAKSSRQILTVDYFFARNDRTPEKERIAADFLASHRENRVWSRLKSLFRRLLAPPRR